MTGWQKSAGRLNPWNDANKSPIQLNAFSLTFEYDVDTEGSEITADPTILDADGVSTSTITVQLKDADGDDLPVSGGTVALELDGSGTLSDVIDNADGTYTATLTSSTTLDPETVTITGTLEGEAIAGDAMIEYVPLSYETQITASPTILDADGFSTSTITVQLKDEDGINAVMSGGIVTLALDGSGTLGSVTDHDDGTYSATLTSSTTLIPEIVTITGTLNGEPIADEATVEYVPLIDVPAQTSQVIRNFMADRADQTIANDVNLAERLTNRGGANGPHLSMAESCSWVRLLAWVSRVKVCPIGSIRLISVRASTK